MRILFCGAAIAPALIGLPGCGGRATTRWDQPVYLHHTSASSETSSGSSSFAPEKGDPSNGPIAPSDEASLRVEDAVLYAVMNHPALRGKALAIRAAAGREAQARLLPNPVFVVEAESVGADAGRGGETKFLFEQEIVTNGRLEKAADVAAVDQLLSRTSFLGDVHGIAASVKARFAGALAAEARLESERELLELADELLAAASAQVEAGSATEPDRLRAEVIREQVAIDLHAAESAVLAARRSLASAMGLESELTATLHGDLAELPALPGREAALEAALAQNTGVASARLAVDRARRAHELEKSQGTPNLVASIGPRYSDFDNETTIDLGIGIELPLFDRNQGSIAAAEAERLIAGASLGSLRLELIGSVTEAWTACESARFAVESYRDSLLPKAERTLELTREAYRAGKADYLRLLDAQQTYVRSRIAYVDALESLHRAAAELEGIVQSETPWRDGAPEEAGS